LKTAKFVWKLASLGLNAPMAKAYHWEDGFFKYLIYRDARQHGMSPEDAVQYALKYIFNYDDLPHTARWIRDVGIPFFAYTYKAVPMVMDTALRYPWRFAAPAAMVSTLNTMVYAMLAGDDGDDALQAVLDGMLNAGLNAYTLGLWGRGDANTLGEKMEAEERALLPEWDKGYSALGTPKTIRWFNDGASGLPVFQNVYRWFPGGDLYDTENEKGGGSWPSVFTPNSPLFTVYSAYFDNKQFNGKALVDENDSPGERARKYADWAYKFAMPAVAPFGVHYDRLAEAFAHYFDTTLTHAHPFKDYTGISDNGEPAQAKYAIGQTLGVKARPVDLALSRQMQQSDKKRKQLDIRAEASRNLRLYRRGALTDREFDQQQAENQEKLRQLSHGEPD